MNSYPLCGFFRETVRMSNMTWALDKQQAAQKYTQITVNGLPHQPPAHLFSSTLTRPPHNAQCSPTPAFSRTLVIMLARKLFGAAVAMLKTSEIIKCFIKLVTGAQPKESSHIFDTFPVLLANSRETYK